LKDGDDDLDIRLIGPDGTTAALFYNGRRKAWGGGRMFNTTTIDDEAPQATQCFVCLVRPRIARFALRA
jgi:hypothetical protein